VDSKEVVMLTVLLYILTGLTALLWILKKKGSKPSSLKVGVVKPAIPGLERSHPTLGNLGELQQAGDLPSFLSSLHAQHGPIASFWFGEVFTVSLAHPTLFRATERMFDRHPALFQLVECLISDKSQQFANGDHGRERYRLFVRAFSQAKMAEVLPKVVTIAREHLEGLPGRVELETTMMKLAIKVITQTHFGVYCKEQSNADKVLDIYMKVFKDFDDAILGKWTMGEDKERDKELHNHVKEFKNIVWTLVVAHRERKASGEFDQAPFLDALLDNVDDDDDILAQAITFMVGGFHTTGINLTWMFYYISLHPEVQERMRAEAREVLGMEGLVSIEQIDGLSYTKKVMDETLRISRLAPFSERKVAEDTDIGGFTIKAGTQVINALCLTLADPEFFPNPEMFDPDRADMAKGLAFSPFGFGVRKCPGWRLANLEAVVTAVAMLSQYQLTLDPTNQRVRPQHGFITKPEKEIWVTLTPVEE